MVSVQPGTVQIVHVVVYSQRSCVASLKTRLEPHLPAVLAAAFQTSTISRSHFWHPSCNPPSVIGGREYARDLSLVLCGPEKFVAIFWSGFRGEAVAHDVFGDDAWNDKV